MTEINRAARGFPAGFERQPDRHESVDFSNLLSLLCKICKRIQRLFDEGAKNTNNSLHSPLGREGGGSYLGGFRAKVGEGMNALSNEM